MPPRLLVPLAAALTAALAISACGSGTSSGAAGPTTTRPPNPAGAGTVAPTSPSAAEATQSPVSEAVSATTLPSGIYLPDPTRTPGAINPAVTQSNIASTICVSGYTKKIRPPASYTTALKIRQLDSGYRVGSDTSTADYEEDHLISLELGGNPVAEANLWPEPWNGPGGAHVKDLIENQLHRLVCAGALALATAQHAIATNWYQAYRTYGGSNTP